MSFAKPPKKNPPAFAAEAGSLAERVARVRQQSLHLAAPLL